MSFDYAALERRVSALESAQNASLRFGRVTSVSGGKVRVELPDGQKVNSYELSTIQKRVLKDQDIKMPDIGEPVACLFSGQGNEQGLVLGAYYNGQENDPGQIQSIDYHRYEDGTILAYDRENHVLLADVKGQCDIKAEKTVTVDALEDITVTSAQRMVISARAELDLKSSTVISLNAPVIRLQGLLDSTDVNGDPGTATLSGNVTVTNGGVSVPDNDVTAGAVSLRGHIHEGVQSGSGTTAKPVGGQK